MPANVANLLLADPEPPAPSSLARRLVEDGFDVVPAAAGAEALELAERLRPDLVLLGGPLPDVPSLELCRRLRRGEPGRAWNREVPVIVLGDGEAGPDERVRAFERGCDDYLARPVLYDELTARIRAVLRRTRGSADDRFSVGDLVVDRATRAVTVRGVRVRLSAREWDLLLKLASEPTRVWTKDQLLRDVWGFRTQCRTRTLDSHASRLRRKLDVDGAGTYVVNVWGVGYRLVES